MAQRTAEGSPRNNAEGDTASTEVAEQRISACQPPSSQPTYDQIVVLAIWVSIPVTHDRQLDFAVELVSQYEIPDPEYAHGTFYSRSDVQAHSFMQMNTRGSTLFIPVPGLTRFGIGAVVLL